MITPYIDENGIHIPTFQEIFDELVETYKAIYGEDIDLNQNTPDGQMLGIQAKTIIDFNEFAVSLYNSFDPDFAIGVSQDKILKLNGIRRQEATRSTVDVNVTCSLSVDLPSDFKIKDTSGNLWVISDAISLPTGTTLVTFYSEKWGKIEALPSTVNEVETVILGVDSVNNPLAAVPGIDEETDEQVRAKRRDKLQISTQSMIGGLTAQLLNYCDDVKVYENKTDTTDENGMPPHSIWAVCEGGEVSDIARTIAIDKNAGCDIKGSIIATYDEPVILNTGEQFIYQHEVKFDRPTVIDIFIRLNVTKKTATSVIDTDLIKQKLESSLYGISDNVVCTELYGYIYQAGDGFIASSIEVSKDGTTWVSDVLTSNLDERLNITSANITITEI